MVGEQNINTAAYENNNKNINPGRSQKHMAALAARSRRDTSRSSWQHFGGGTRRNIKTSSGQPTQCLHHSLSAKSTIILLLSYEIFQLCLQSSPYALIRVFVSAATSVSKLPILQFLSCQHRLLVVASSINQQPVPKTCTTRAAPDK